MSSSKKSVELSSPTIYPRSSHTISRSSIDSDALKIMYRLIRHGYIAYLVGGGVRDVLLGKKPKDFDIATNATPRQVKSLFRNCRIIGRRFKLAHIFYPQGKIIEVSTFRDITINPDIEDETQGNNLIIRDNQFGTAETDARRRDITINGLFYDVSTFSIIDYVGGIADLKNGIVRVIGDPDVRFAEDPVRLLRVVRHAARNGFSIEKNCLESLVRNRELLSQSAPVRVYEEFKKDLGGGRLLPILRLLSKTGLLVMLLPHLSDAAGTLLEDGAHLPIVLERLDTNASLGQIIPIHVVLAVLLLHLPIDAVFDTADEIPKEEQLQAHIKKIFSTLVVPRKERERIEQLLQDWNALNTVNELQSTALSTRITDERLYDLMTLYQLMHGEEPDPELLDSLKPHGEKSVRSNSKNRRRSRSRKNKRKSESSG